MPVCLHVYDVRVGQRSLPKDAQATDLPLVRSTYCRDHLFLTSCLSCFPATSPLSPFQPCPKSRMPAVLATSSLRALSAAFSPLFSPPHHASAAAGAPPPLQAYFSRHPVVVLRRNSEVVSKLSSFVMALLADWKTGQWEANMPMRAKHIRRVRVCPDLLLLAIPRVFCAHVSV